MDPWEAAATLTGLAQIDALERLDGIILAVKDVSTASVDHLGIATRLAALLLRATRLTSGVKEALGLGATSPDTQKTIWVIVIAVLLIGQTVALRSGLPTSGSNRPATSTAPVTGNDDRRL